MPDRQRNIVVRLRGMAAAAMAAAIAAGCSGVPGDVIAPDDMARLMADIHMGEAVVEQNRINFASDSSRQLLKQSIYARHGVSSAQVDSSMMWYGRNIERYTEVYEMAQEYIEQQIAEANEIAASAVERAPMMSFEADGDSVDIWPLYRSRPFGSNWVDDRITFLIKSDRYWEKGDIYHLRFKGVDAPERFDVTIAAEYSSGAVDYASATFEGNGWHDLYLHLNDSLGATIVSGVIAYPYAGRSGRPGIITPRVDSISLVRMRDEYSSRTPNSFQKSFNFRR